MLYYLYNGDELLGFIYNNNTYYYHKNLFGDIIGIYDSNYNEIVTYKYNSWGVIKNITDNSNINLGIINPFRYRSYYYDEETQLYYLNSRYYNPEIGRFINADSIINSNSDVISNNLFQYCSNNYVNKLDKTGRYADAINDFWYNFNQHANKISDLIATALALSTSDGALPIGDIIGIGILLFGTISLIDYSLSVPKENAAAKRDKSNFYSEQTIIYRYGKGSPSNMTPKEKDAHSGLSFSTIPPAPGKDAMVTTVELVNSTGILEAVKDGPTHYSIKPVDKPVIAWVILGSQSFWTIAITRVCVKWDNGERWDKFYIK